MFKASLSTFGKVFGHYWNFENFSTLAKIFQISTLHSTLGRKNLISEKSPTLLGTFLKNFVILKNFQFRNVSKSRHSIVHWAKKN